MAAVVETPRASDRAALDAAVARLRQGARLWATLPVVEKIALARSMLRGVGRTAERLVAAANAAKGIRPGSPLCGEEWMSGPWVVARILRQLIRSLTGIQRNGNTPIGSLGETIDGRLTARVFPGGRLDALLFPAVRADVHFEQGVDVKELHASRARFYKTTDPPGRVCLVLGAGNVSSIPFADVLTKLFNEGKVCVLKTNPVNAYVGPFVEEALGEAVARGFLSVVYGGADEGSYLARHPGVDEVHITGSAATHDLIVWGPPGPERAERMARDKPLLDKPITSELGNVSPVLLVPGPYDDRQLEFSAEGLAGAVAHNNSYNCNSAKMLVTPRGWKRRDAFLDAVERYLALAPPRLAWYPGTQERYRTLTEPRSKLRRVGGGEGALPWTLVTDLDAEDSAERAFTVEPFCPILSEVPLASDDPFDYLAKAVDFANDRLWGTLSATIVVHPKTMADAGVRAALERAIVRLRFGTVAVNVWPGFGFAMGTTPWGGHPGSPLTDVQSGCGWVHNTRMLEHVEKVVIRHPLTVFPKLPYFPSHRTGEVLGRRLTELEVGHGWLKLAGVVAAAVRG